MDKKDITPEIKAIRIMIDTILNSFHLVNQSAEITLAKRSLQLGYAWLGESLKDLGNASPYTGSMDASSKTIEDRADQSPASLYNDRWNDTEKYPATQTARVKDLRFLLQDVIGKVREFMIDNKDAGFGPIGLLQALSQANVHLVNSKIWLGWELGRIRDHQKMLERNPTGDFAGGQAVTLPNS